MSRFVALFVLFLALAFTNASSDTSNDVFECYGCKLLVKQVENYVSNNASIGQVEDYIKSLCTYTNGFKSICEEEVNVVVETIIGYLENSYSSAQICELLGFCPLQIDSLECLSCKLLVQQVENYLFSNSSVSELEEYIYGLCNYTRSLANLCDMEAKELIETIVQYLKNEATPSEICGYFGVCPATTKISPCVICSSYYTYFSHFVGTKISFDESDCSKLASIVLNKPITTLEITSCM
jgi:uncharacterized protein YlzI (FlbEa/FlbD family)